MTIHIDKNKTLIVLSESDKVQCWREPFAIQSVPQKVFSAIWGLEAEVNNGGFAQYFINSSSESAPFVVTALETIGARKVADICRRAIRTAFPEGLPETQQAIIDSAEARYDALAEELDQLTQEFFTYPDDLTELLFEFVVKHPDEFGDVTNAIGTDLR